MSYCPKCGHLMGHEADCVLLARGVDIGTTEAHNSDMEQTLTVGELRRVLEEWPDNRPVIVVNEDSGWRGIRSTETGGHPFSTKSFFIYLGSKSDASGLELL